MAANSEQAMRSDMSRSYGHGFDPTVGIFRSYVPPPHPRTLLRTRRGGVRGARRAPNRSTAGNLKMSHSHAVVWTDHQTAQVLQFDSEPMRVKKIRSHNHYTRQHG